jgi:hypothetical protein
MKYLLSFALFVVAFIPISGAAQTPRYARVISENANLRDAPAVTGVSQQEVPEGTLVKVLDEKLPWFVMRVGNRVGWMHGNTIEFIRTQDPVTEPSNQQIVVPDYRPITPSASRREPSRTVNSSSATARGYIRGPRGGCYYLSGSGRKVYVDHSLCN